VADQVTAATGGIPTQVFVFMVDGDVFNRIATVADLNTLPTSHADAVTQGKDAYRLAAMQVDYASLGRAQEAATTIVQRLEKLLTDFDNSANAFVGVTTETLTS
jgi:hypothetical protein